MSKVTLGGDRLGSGNRMKQEMHNFFRSNHNLSKSFKSSMAAGVLYPCYCNVGLKGDTWDIDLDAFVRTIPTRGPLFGSFKLQVDFFQVPVRLFQGILHNNTLEIGMNMSDVLFPTIKLAHRLEEDEETSQYATQIHPTSLLKYLGLSGIGVPDTWSGEAEVIEREFNALPVLSYYEIFKNYYANKQEDYAYVITGENFYEAEPTIQKFKSNLGTNVTRENYNYTYYFKNAIYRIVGKNLNLNNITLGGQNDTDPDNAGSGTTLQVMLEDGNIQIISQSQDLIKFKFTNNSPITSTYIWVTSTGQTATQYDIELTKFLLQNIDTEKRRCLGVWDFGTKETINSITSLMPYKALVGQTTSGESVNTKIMNGLCVKTYQSDMYNNWLQTEWVDMIESMSSVTTTSGSFSIDSLNFAEKIYNLYNRIAISGGSYDDWQEAVYGDKVWGKSEKPIYCGGMSSEVVFEEVVSTAATSNDPLGSLGGRGKLNGRNGGKIVIKVNEASLIMGIVSLTPRIDYAQGNKWYMTDIQSVDDFHKPNLDCIGFQDLYCENFAWWDARIERVTGEVMRTSAGKQPAWIHYMTDVNEVYGDFASDEDKSFMVLTRQYEQDNGVVGDVTTYIDPSKFNYAFAYQELAAQNFWTFINFDIKCRRKMSATQIPNL